MGQEEQWKACKQEESIIIWIWKHITEKPIYLYDNQKCN